MIKLIGKERNKNKLAIYGVMSFLVGIFGLAVYCTIFWLL